MARSGRFGRLPSEAPDLTASIVSMMQQYQSARDDNIFDAWKNGGEFEGSPVTDQRLLRYIHDRRSQYTRDEPEWDEWDNMLYQYRFSIAEQKALLRYDRAMAAAAGIDKPRAQLAAQAAASGMMTNFYRSWSQRLPENSAAYRDLMRSAAQYTKAVQTANSRSRGIKRDKAKANKPTEYEIYNQRVRGIEREMVTPYKTVMAALDYYGQAIGFLNAGQTLMDLNTLESADFNNLLDGITNDPTWPTLRNYLRRQLPPGSWNGELDMDTLNAFSHLAERGIKQQISLAKGYSGDLSSHVDGYRKSLREARAARDIDNRLTASEIITRVWDDEQDDRLNSSDPFTELTDVDGKNGSVARLEKAMRVALGGRQFDLAGDIRVAIAAIRANEQDIEFLNTLDPADRVPLWAPSGGDVIEMAYTRWDTREAAKGLQAGTHYLKYDASSADYKERVAGGMPPRTWSVAAYSDTPPGWTDFVVPRVGPDGQVYDMYVPGSPVYLGGETDQEADLYMGEYDGHRIYKQWVKVGRDGQPLQTGRWQHTTEDAWDTTGVRLRAGRDGFVAVDPSRTLDANVARVFDTNMVPTAAGGQPTAADLTASGLFTPDEVEEQEQLRAQADIRRAERSAMLNDAGLMEAPDGSIIQRVGLGPSFEMRPEDIQASVDAIEARLDETSPIPKPGATQTPIDDILAGVGTGTRAAQVQMGLAMQNDLLAYSTATQAAMNNDPLSWQNLGKADITRMLQTASHEPGYTPEAGQSFIAGWERDKNIRRDGVRGVAAVLASESGGSTRTEAGLRTGAALAETDDEALRRWDLAADLTGQTPEQRVALQRMGRTAVPFIQQLQGGLRGMFGTDTTAPTSRDALPIPTGGAAGRGRSAPDVVMASNLTPAGMSSATRTGPPVNMPSNISPVSAIVKPPKSAPLREAMRSMQTGPRPMGAPASIVAGSGQRVRQGPVPPPEPPPPPVAAPVAATRTEQPLTYDPYAYVNRPGVGR